MRFDLLVIITTESPTWLQEPSDVSAMLGSKVMIPCKGMASPKPEVVWSRETSSPESFSRVLSVDRDGVLFFNAMNVSDAGRYQCRVSNGVGAPLVKVISIQVNGTYYVVILSPVPFLTESVALVSSPRS